MSLTKRGRTILRAIRVLQEPKVSQALLAARAGMSAARYWQIENGLGAEPSEREREAIAAALDVKVSAIQWPERIKAAKAS